MYHIDDTSPLIKEEVLLYSEDLLELRNYALFNLLGGSAVCGSDRAVVFDLWLGS